MTVEKDILLRIYGSDCWEADANGKLANVIFNLQDHNKTAESIGPRAFSPARAIYYSIELSKIETAGNGINFEDPDSPFHRLVDDAKKERAGSPVPTHEDREKMAAEKRRAFSVATAVLRTGHDTTASTPSTTPPVHA